MINYLLLREDGSIFQRGSCPTKEEIPAIQGCRHEIIKPEDGRRAGQGPGPTYRDFRAMEYPTVGDQLDAIWKLVSKLGIPPGDDAGRLLERIKAVKEAHPKPENR